MAQPTQTGFDSGSTTSNASSYTTSSKTFTAGRLYLIGFTATMTSGTINDPTVFRMTTNTSVTWTLVRHSASTQPRSFWGIVRVASTITDTVTITFGTQSITGLDWVMIELTGYKDTGTLSDAYGSNHNDASGSSASPSVALTSAPTSNSRTLGWGYQGANAGFTAGGNFTKIIETAGHASPNARGAMEGDKNGSAETTADWSITSANWIAMVIEVKSADAIAAPSSADAVAAVPAPTGQGGGISTPAVASAVVATPTATAQGAGIATPAVCAAVAAVPTATESGAATAAPVVAAAIGAVPAATGRVDIIASPTAAAAVGDIPAPTAQGGAVGAPAVAISVVAVPTATESGTALVAPSSADAVAAVPDPTAMGGGVATPDVAAAIGDVPEPTVSGGGPGTALPGVCAAVVAVPAPSAQGTAEVFPDTATVLAAVGTPNPEGAAAATPDVLDVMAEIPDATATTGTSANVSPDSVNATAAFPHLRVFTFYRNLGAAVGQPGGSERTSAGSGGRRTTANAGSERTGAR